MSERETVNDATDAGTNASNTPTNGGKSPSNPVQIESSDALAETVDSYGVVLTDFYADWCGPCNMIAPVVAELAAETDAAVAKVDVDANQQLAAEYGVRGVPTLVLFADGEVVEQVVGAQSKEQLRALIEQHQE
jgi:thioredoxin 1